MINISYNFSSLKAILIIAQCFVSIRILAQVFVNSNEIQNTKIVECLDDRLEKAKLQYSDLSCNCLGYMKYNFGVVVNNSKHKIYRSQALGEKGLKEIFKHLSQKNMPQPKFILHFNKHGYKNSSKSFLSLFHDPFVKYSDFVLQESKAIDSTYQKQGIDFYHPINSDIFFDGYDPSIEKSKSFRVENLLSKEAKNYFYNIKKYDKKIFLMSEFDNFFNAAEIVLKQKDPVLFHCTGGMHRSGMIALLIRHIQGGDWIKDLAQSIKIIIRKKGHIYKEFLLKNKAELEYYLHNTFLFREENIIAINKIIKDERFKKLKNKYQKTLTLRTKC